MSQDNLTAEMANPLAAYRSYKENPYRLTDEQIENIRLGTELILSAIDENNTRRKNATNQDDKIDVTYFQILEFPK
jgi:hypothetical protein